MEAFVLPKVVVSLVRRGCCCYTLGRAQDAPLLLQTCITTHCRLEQRSRDKVCAVGPVQIAEY